MGSRLLEGGRWLLEAGCQLMEVGYWLMEVAVSNTTSVSHMATSVDRLLLRPRPHKRKRTRSGERVRFSNWSS